MAGPRRAALEVSTPGEDAQLSEEMCEPLAWQSELDVAIAEIDSRLSHPRRRATDAQPALPTLGQPEITTEMIDEIAWRVSELLRGDDRPPVRGSAVVAAISQISAPAPPRAPRAPSPLPQEPERLPDGVVLTIRLRRPFFRMPWPFRRRQRQAMITFNGQRAT